MLQNDILENSAAYLVHW